MGVYHYRGGSSITRHHQFRLIYRGGLPPHRKSARSPHTGTPRVPSLSHRYVLEEHYLAGSEHLRNVREYMR